MGLSWINPLYLAGIALLALPVLIHLVHQHHPSGFKFPSLMFLERIPLQQKRRLEIRHWLLLLLRCLLLLLILLAFARPFFTDPGAVATADDRRSDSVILIDRSYSMRLGERWQQAQRKALDIIDRSPADARTGIVLFDDEATVANDLSDDVAELRALIARQQPGLRGTRLRPAVEQAARLLVGSTATQKRIYLISDFSAAADGTPRIADDIELVTLPLDLETAANATIASLRIGPSPRAAADEFSLEVEIANHSPLPLQQNLSLWLDGRELERRELDLAAGATRRESFADLVVTGGLGRGELRLDDDALAIDNRAYFVFSSRHQVPVLLLEGQAPRSNQSVYLEQALELSQQPLYRVRRMRIDNLQPQDLAAFALVIINDAALPGGAAGQALRDFVEAGGGLLIATGSQLQGNWPSTADGYAAGDLSRQVDATPGRAFRIGVLSAPLDTSDLRRARIFNYRRLEPQDGERVLARFDSGDAALLQRDIGAGTTLVLATTLDPHWNDLALKPNFLPFLHAALRQMAAFESYPNSVRIGEVVDVMRYARALAGGDAIVAGAIDSDLTIEAPDASETRLERQTPLLAVAAAGFYQVHRATPSDVEVVLAANIDATESKPLPLDLKQFVEDIKSSALEPAAGAVVTDREADSFEQQQQWWYVILSLALVLMLIEGFSANWVAGRRPQRS